MSRRLLYRSTVWEIARPRHPLTSGHVLIRLSDPATEFALPSASDWLLCYRLARAALQEALDITLCPVMFAHRWHPLGGAIGEPVAESSTPTFHLFGRWSGETTTPGHQLSLPAHRRAGEDLEQLEAIDAAMRLSLGRGAAEVTAPPVEGAAVVHEPGLEDLVQTTPAGPNHSVIRPTRTVDSIGEITPGELLAMGVALGALPQAGGPSGLSCVAVEPSGPRTAVRLHVLGRSAAEDVNPMESLIRSPEVSLALL